MKQVKVKSPGTCGEYIQGWYQGNPCLISCPINCYSTVTVEEGDYRKNVLKAKSQKMVEQFLEKNYLSKVQYEQVHIRVESDIPESKGMASSTADLAGIATALSCYFDLGFRPDEIGRLCAAIEPSDNLMFEELNLFNHLSGNVLREIGGSIQANVLIIDFEDKVDTMNFNECQDDYCQEELREFAGIINFFEQGLKENDLSKIGQACTQSAYLNQKRLYKNQLDTISQLVEDYKGLGIVVGHSGTVIGVIYDSNFQKQNFLLAIYKEISNQDYVYDQCLIKGGVEIITEPTK